jgi:hypothetical protein
LSIGDGSYILDLEDKSIYNINAKRFRPNDLNPTFIWYYRLGHINEKRIEKSHKDGLLRNHLTRVGLVYLGR